MINKPAETKKSGIVSRTLSLSAKFHIYLAVVAILVFAAVFAYKTIGAHADSSGVLSSGTIPSNPGNVYVNYTAPNNGTMTLSLNYTGVTPGYAELVVLMGGERLTSSSYGNPIVITFNVAASTNYLFSLGAHEGSGTYTLNYSLTNNNLPPTTTPFYSMPCFYTPWYDLPPQLPPYTDIMSGCPNLAASDSNSSAPAAPANLKTMVLGSSGIDLSWDATTDSTVAGYRIYRGTSSNNLTYIGTTISAAYPGSAGIIPPRYEYYTSWPDPDLNPSTTYYYAVEAFTSQNVSVPSRVSVATYAYLPPNTPVDSGTSNSSHGSNTPGGGGGSGSASTPPSSSTPTAYVGINIPANNATLSGVVQVSGYASGFGDNAPVTSVDLEIDNDGFISASGPPKSWFYQLNTRLYANTTHTITVKATNSLGKVRTAYITVTIKNGSYSTTAPTTQGKWISPEGMTITVDSKGKNPHTGQPWTIADIYYMTKSCASGTGDFSTLAPNYTVVVNDNVVWQGAYDAFTETSAQSNGGRSNNDQVWANFYATTYLNGSRGAMLTQPYGVSCYEYGHVWTEYYYYIVNYPALSSISSAWGAPPNYMNERWVNSTGTITLAKEFYPCINFIDSWDGCISDDRRLLFGGPGANGGSDSTDLAPGEPHTGYQEPAIRYQINNLIQPQYQPDLALWYTQHWITGK